MLLPNPMVIVRMDPLLLELISKVVRGIGRRGGGRLERETRIELATATLEGWNSTVELLPLNIKE